MTAAVLRSARFSDGSVVDGLNLPVVERALFVDPVSRELFVNCVVNHEAFSEPYDSLNVHASGIEALP